MKHCKALLCIVAITLLLSACGTAKRDQTTATVNPYISTAENHVANGIVAMQQERWELASRSFSRALTAAQLADDSRLITRAWYNLASAYSASGQFTEAEAAYQKTLVIALRRNDQTSHLRAQLAMYLMQQRTERLPESFSMQQLPASLYTQQRWPDDLHLQAARLAQRLDQPELAQAAYKIVIANKKTDHFSLKMRAEAHMGLALLARDSGSIQLASREVGQVLAYCHQLGAPLLTAHALMLQAELTPVMADKQDKLDRALDIYSALNDIQGKKQALQQLLAVARSEGNNEAEALLELRLLTLEAKLAESN